MDIWQASESSLTKFKYQYDYLLELFVNVHSYHVMVEVY